MHQVEQEPDGDKLIVENYVTPGMNHDLVREDTNQGDKERFYFILAKKLAREITDQYAPDPMCHPLVVL